MKIEQCDKCEKEIDIEKDSHAVCDFITCNAILCNDTMDCIRDHMEYTHGTGWTNIFPSIKS